MDLLNDLKALGVNVEEAVERFMGNEGLYKRMLGTFPGMVEKTAVPVNFDELDYADIIEKTHALKGATGNLSLTPLYEAYTEIVAELRAENPQKAKEILNNMLPVQEQIIACINKYA